MPEASPNLIQSIFAKTSVGQQEVQSRSLGLPPLPRRLLILVDGKRSGKELAVFVEGHNPGELLKLLLDNGCIEAIAVKAAPEAPAPVDPAHTSAARADGAALAKLPEAATRTAKEVEMARNVMMNTLNAVFQQNTRLTLMKTISSCRSAEEVRSVYPKWADNMRASPEGAKRLPEFNVKLFAVL